jgi:hypothetical protein
VNVSQLKLRSEKFEDDDDDDNNNKDNNNTRNCRPINAFKGLLITIVLSCNCMNRD